jgi:predicted RNA-binding protein with RPS1 domain
MRHLSYYYSSFDFKEICILNALKSIFANESKFNLPTTDFSITKGDVYSLTKLIPEKNQLLRKQTKGQLPKSFKAKIKYANFFGYIINYDTALYVLPYNDSNLSLKKNDEIDVDVVAYDPVLNIGLSIQSKSNSAYINGKRELINQEIEEGRIVRGIIKSIVDFGIFVNIGAKDGLLHNSKVSYHSTDLKKIFSVGDEILVEIEKSNGDKIELNRISALKNLAKSNIYKINDKVKGKILRIDEKRGLFLELENGGKGFIRMSNIFFERQPINLFEFFEIGESVFAKVIPSKEEDSYELSITALYSEKTIYTSIKKDGSYSAKVCSVDDIKSQIEKILNRRLDVGNSLEFFCPKCQAVEYTNPNQKRSNLEVSTNKKSWYCLWCDYHSSEKLILKFFDFPLIVSSNIDHLKYNNYENIIGAETFVKIKNINYNDRIIDVELSMEKIESEIIPKDLDITKKISKEIGYI